MRALSLVLLAVGISGCCQSRYAHDPRAAVVGPDYLDYVANYPRDCATEYYYPSFQLTGATQAPPSPAPMALAPSVQALLIERPPLSERAQAQQGKGYPDLEATGIRLFTRAGD